jgi:hypothetical protein
MRRSPRRPLPTALRVFLTAMSLLALVFFASAFTGSSKSLTDAATRSSTTTSPASPAVNSVLVQQVKTAAAAAAQAHLRHEAHVAHMAKLKLEAELAAAAKAARELAAKQAAEKAAQKPAVVTEASVSATAPAPAQAAYSGVLTAAEVGQLWLDAGGPSWAEPKAEEIAFCESGYNTSAYNPSGATGLWQILGSVVPGNLDNPVVNAENAVAKFKASGDTFAPWVCQ